MTAGTEQQAAIGIAEGRVVGIGCHGVGAGFLLRETDVVLHAKLLFVLRGFLLHEGFEEGAMLGRYGEVHAHGTVARLAIACTFHEVLFEGRASAVCIAVELEEALGQAAIVQAILAQHCGSHCLVFTFAEQGMHTLAVQLLAGSVEVFKEGCVVNALEIFLLEIGLGSIVGGIHKGEDVLEHTAGGTRSGHKLHHLVLRVGSIFIPSSDEGSLFFLAGHEDALTHGGGTI